MRYITILAATLLVGCSSKSAPVAVATPTDPNAIEVIERLNRDTERIGKVEGLSCETGWREVQEGKYEIALAEAKIAAAALGADGIAEVKVAGPKSAFSCATRGGVRVSAVAYKNRSF
ncbi:MAG: hypothetical protein IBJ07_12225 [Rhizobiaceae bacterium]|nr:hypothetical protein [Rhizobiaceae bacterium]